MPHWSGAAQRTVCPQAWLGRADVVVCSKHQGVLYMPISPVPLHSVASNLLPSGPGACITSLLLWLQ